MDELVPAQKHAYWVPIAGVVFGAATLAFFMYLVIANPPVNPFLVVTVLALGLGLASSFLGGDAAARGQIPIPFVKEHPIQFSAAGGIAVFVIVWALGMWLYPAQGTVSVSKAFVATNIDEPYAVKARFGGSVMADSQEIRVRINEATLSFPEALPNGEQRQYISVIRVSLARPDEFGSWFPLSESSPHEIDSYLDVGSTLELDAMEFVLPTVGATALTGLWLVFDIGVSESPSSTMPGTSHVFVTTVF